MPAGNEKQQGDDELFGAILAFEQILEAMPDDHTSLETLWHAYEQIGDLSKARDYMLRLARVVCAEQDAEAAASILPAVRESAGDDPDMETAELINVLDVLQSTSGAQASGAGRGGASADDAGASDKSADAQATITPVKREALARGFSIADELSFAWTLLEMNELNQDEYSGVVQDLTEMSSSEGASTVSVLHVLEARAFKNLERIIGLVSRACGTPFIVLDSFDLQLESIRILPLEFCQRRGAIVFESIGKLPLVVIMNPYDKQLKADVEAVAGCECSFFMALPSDFDRAIGNMAQMIKDAAAAEAAE